LGSLASDRLVVASLDKAYAAPVLKDVNLTIARGEIHALVGENGAGKTTLLNILSGLTGRDAGRLILDGQPYEPARPADAFAAGVSCATQELSIITTLSVAENVSLRCLPQRHGIIDQAALRAKAKEMLSLVGLGSVASSAEAGELSLAERQLLEIARAFAGEPSLLLLDEPTAALNAIQTDRLHDILRQRTADGLSVIYVSHRLNDVLAIADRVSVLRDGRVVGSGPSADFSVDELVALMAGASLAAAANVASDRSAGQPLIRAEGITSRKLPIPVSLTAAAGEIVGLAGLAGAGRSELLHALFGLDTLTSGLVLKRVGDTEVEIRDATIAARNGLALVGEDRQSMGLFNGLSVTDNMMLPGDRRQRSRLRTIDRARERAASRSLIDKLGIACRSPDQDIGELSGGNQQKALIGRWLNAGADVFLLDEPTRGVDVNTKAALYRQFRELAENGCSLLVASSELEELMLICDRIIVLSDRRIAAEFRRDSYSEEAILSAAFSAFAGRAAVNA